MGPLRPSLPPLTLPRPEVPTHPPLQQMLAVALNPHCSGPPSTTLPRPTPSC